MIDKKKVLVVWEYPQLTEDPIAEAFSLENGEKVDEAELDCTNFYDGGGRIIPGNGISYTEQLGVPDKFLQDNKEFSGLPSVDVRYKCIEREGIPGKFNTVEEIFKKHFSTKFEVVAIRRIRNASTK